MSLSSCYPAAGDNFERQMQALRDQVGVVLAHARIGALAVHEFKRRPGGVGAPAQDAGVCEQPLLFIRLKIECLVS